MKFGAHTKKEQNGKVEDNEIKVECKAVYYERSVSPPRFPKFLISLKTNADSA